MTAGLVIGTAFGVVRRHLAALAPIAILIGILSAAVELVILASAGTLADFATGAWAEQIVKGTGTSLPASYWTALIASELISLVGGLVLAGLATAFAGADAMGDTGPGSGRRRLAGRVGVLLGVSVLAGLATAVGAALLLIPGVVIYLTWMLAAPAAVMERSDLGSSLRRSAALSTGHRMRFLGVMVLSMLIGGFITGVAQALAGTLAATATSVVALLVSESVGAVVAGLTASWTGAVIAVLYIDIRIRTENLGPALRAYAAARPRPAGGPALA
jgi:hypothetical protein